MLPAGPLMIEHRLIERMVKLMQKELETARSQRKVCPNFIQAAVDFMKTYADRCHHGKEEDILFKSLAQKPMSAEHKRIMEELLKEHVVARKHVMALIEANKSYVQGDKNVLPDILDNLEVLTSLYPKHIEKEDKHFFLPCMNYFSQDEKDRMLRDFEEFDRTLIHSIRCHGHDRGLMQYLPVARGPNGHDTGKWRPDPLAFRPRAIGKHRGSSLDEQYREMVTKWECEK